MNWRDQCNEAELNAIMEGLSILIEFGFFEKFGEELRASLLAGTISADDSVIVQSIKDYRAKINLLTRLKADAIELVKPTSGEN